MNDLHTSLLREKFVIHDPGISADGKGPVVALSNRIEVELRNPKNKLEETLVVRAQNMALCVRMGARILQSYNTSGPLLTRTNPYDWDAAWDTMLNDYEIAYNPTRWVAIYNQGKIVYSKGDHHPLLDVIENCQEKNKKDYDSVIPMAQDAFRQMGKVVRIDYDGNVALSAHLGEKQTRFGVIVRGPGKTATFNFSVTPKTDRDLNLPQCLGAAAAFLEGIQLSFMVGMNEEKIRLGLIERHSKEEKQTREARMRLSRLNAEISTLEGSAEVRYRPERPEFQQILADAEKMAKTMLSAKPKGGKKP